MGFDPVTVVTNSVYHHDQSIDLGIDDSDTAWRPDWNETALRHAGTTYVVVFVQERSLRVLEFLLAKSWRKLIGTTTSDRWYLRQLLQDELPDFLEDVPVQTLRQMCDQHDRAPPHFSQVVRQYLNHKFPNRWIGRDGVQNWPPRSPDQKSLDYQEPGRVRVLLSCVCTFICQVPLNGCDVCYLRWEIKVHSFS